VKIVTYNIQFGRGRDDRVDLHRIASAVQGADIIALQEVDRYWPRSQNVDQVTALSRLLPGYYWAYGAGLDIVDPTTAAEPQARGRRRQFGNLFLSRYPLLSVRNHLLPQYAGLNSLSIQRSALEVLIDTRSSQLRLYNLHLTHLSSATRTRQLHHLLELHDQAGITGPPISGRIAHPDWPVDLPQLIPSNAVLMGDFNLEHNSPEYSLLAGPVCDYGGRIENPCRFVDAWVATDHDEAGGVTSDIHGRPVRLDYFFVSCPLQSVIRDCWIDCKTQGSDHQPVWLDVKI